MAVQKHKKSRSKRGMRRSHDKLYSNKILLIDKKTGKKHLYHHIDDDGFYRGKQIIIKNNN
ncbi:50S ribosomal protein L32 [Enterobacteriaceae endosymbiont of Donacia versicolorea]|uniref:50S ribosomal protein L32 n=1 Tax=unclassified Enterobacteriaceae TaxID=36866 RepID=UPI001449D13B|nr:MULTISPECIES: 50S ribosomal protein L32 [unclassified Enterobacteriaceae]QJC31959.1 50S ribosomal protein L32 [Enterobacteriaceae endosymbiont of Donacia versicolorea]QJC32363.1 50S ribosomal protein L32 [Enterobacteriaceae endosymbiont of Donacia dentata]